MSTHNICFHGEKRKLLSGYPSYLFRAMDKYLEMGLVKNKNIFYKSL